MRYVALVALMSALVSTACLADDAERIAYTRTILLLQASCSPPHQNAEKPQENGKKPYSPLPAKQVLYFGASWCGPCNRMKRETFPVLVKAGWRIGRGGDTHVNVLDADHDSALAGLHKVKSVPTSILVENGKEVRRLTGFASASRLVAFWGKEPPSRTATGQRWTYSGHDLAKHLVETHNLTPSEVAGLSHAELVRLHSDAHNEGR